MKHVISIDLGIFWDITKISVKWTRINFLRPSPGHDEILITKNKATTNEGGQWALTLGMHIS